MVAKFIVGQFPKFKRFIHISLNSQRTPAKFTNLLGRSLQPAIDNIPGTNSYISPCLSKSGSNSL